MTYMNRLGSKDTEANLEDGTLDSSLDDLARPVIRAAVPVLALDVFPLWIEHVNLHARYGKESINLTLSTSYAFIWRSWCKYLGNAVSAPPEAVPSKLVMDATPTDIARFIDCGPTGSKPDRPISKNTQRRYFTVLQRVYAFCSLQGWVRSNPADDVEKQDRPPEELHEGHILNQDQWQACTAHIEKISSNAIEIRDKAVLMLLFKYGLRPEEIRALRLQDLQQDISGSHILEIQSIRGPEQERRIPIDEPTTAVLKNWKKARQSFMVVQRTLDKHQADMHNSDLAKACDTMFVSRASMGLAMVTLMKLVRTHIEQSCANAGLELPKRMGPQVVRNTRLIRWLNAGKEVPYVVRLAGLKNAKGLVHLIQSCNDDVRQQLLPARRRDDDHSKSNILAK